MQQLSKLFRKVSPGFCQKLLRAEGRRLEALSGLWEKSLFPSAFPCRDSSRFGPSHFRILIVVHGSTVTVFSVVAVKDNVFSAGFHTHVWYVVMELCCFICQTA